MTLWCTRHTTYFVLLVPLNLDFFLWDRASPIRLVIWGLCFLFYSWMKFFMFQVTSHSFERWCLVAVFYQLDHPLKRREPETLTKLNMCLCIAGYSDNLPLNIIVSSESFTCHVFIRMGHGSLIDWFTWFAIHRTGEGGFGYKIFSPASIFTAELTALFVTLQHIGEVIKTLVRWFTNVNRYVATYCALNEVEV
jgi:hypothetical protein